MGVLKHWELCLGGVVSGTYAAMLVSRRRVLKVLKLLLKREVKEVNGYLFVLSCSYISGSGRMLGSSVV